MDEFKEVIKTLDRLTSNVKKIVGEHKVLFTDLFNSDFMEENTNFDSWEDFLKAGELENLSEKEFEELDEILLDKLVIRYTDFNSWEEMLEEASVSYIENQIYEEID